MLPKAEVICQIKKRFKGRKPLNIAAVKRVAPELIEAAYQQTPFWGWKQALEAADIDYAKIHTEISDYVTCRICGKEMKAIGGLHFERDHNTSAGEYLEEFPDAEVRSEAMRCFIPGSKLILPHWEPFATPEYVLDRAFAIHQHGYPINQREILLHEPTLIRNAMQYFSKWDEVLRRIGLNPTEIRRCTENGVYTKAFVRSELQRIYEETGDVSKAALIENGHSTLYQRAVRFYDNLESALKAVGINPAEHSKYSGYQQEYEQFAEKARKLIGLYGRERRDLSRQIRIEGRRFISARFKNNWSRFAKAEGIPISRLDRRAYPTRKDAMHELKRRTQLGLPIGQTVLVEEDCPLHVAVVQFWSNYTRLNKAMRRWR